MTTTRKLKNHLAKWNIYNLGLKWQSAKKFIQVCLRFNPSQQMVKQKIFSCWVETQFYVASLNNSSRNFLLYFCLTA